MRGWVSIVLLTALFSCDSSRVYEQQMDFENRSWILNNQPRFDFTITDHTKNYNIYCTVRNSLTFPYSRIFVSYYLNDSSGNQLRKGLVSTYLFDQKTGKPNGSSGLGDLFDHRIPLLTRYHFERPGVYSLSLEKFNRMDTLKGVLAVGLRVEVSNME